MKDGAKEGLRLYRASGEEWADSEEGGEQIQPQRVGQESGRREILPHQEQLLGAPALGLCVSAAATPWAGDLSSLMLRSLPP